MTVTAIVLAGGRSSRFGGDKLAAPFDGRSLLGATIDLVASVADEVLVAGPRLPSGFAPGRTHVAIVRDHEPFAGPLVALANVLERASSEPDDLALVVGGDMPRLVPAVLRAMLDRVAVASDVAAVLLAGPAEAQAIPEERRPRRSVLPMAVRVSVARRAARAAVESGDRSLQALVDRLAHVELPSAAWRELDPVGATLVDVDTPEDLARLAERERR